MTASLSFALGQICYYSALVAKPSPYRWLLMVPIVLSTAYFYRYAVQYHTPLEYTYGCAAIAQLFIASSYILMTDAQRRLFLKGQKEPAWCLPLFERVKWAMKLSTTLRCIGWSHEPTHALPPPTSTSTTRTGFVVQEIGRLALDILLYDAVATYAKGNPSFTANGSSIAGDSLFWRVMNVLVLGFGGVICISIPYRFFSILAVSFAISEPQDWLPPFGSVLDAYSLRTFWGRSWHQLLRWPGVSHGRFLAYELLHLHRKSKMAFFVQLYTTFTITALIHVGGEYTVLGYWSNKHALRFFLLQPIAITVEELVIQNGRNLSIQGPWRLLGYLWVLTWFTYTVPEWINPLLRGGLVDTAPSLGIVSRLADIKFWCFKLPLLLNGATNNLGCIPSEDALVVKPSPYRRLLMLPIVAAVVSFFRSALQYQTFSEYTLACILLVHFFSASDYILLTDVQQELFEKGQTVPVHKLPLFKRVQWAARLYVGIRCVDWSHEPIHALPPRPSPAITRPKFVLKQLYYLALELAIFEVLTTYTKSSPCFAMNGHSMAGDGVFWLAVNVAVYGISASTAIDMSHRVLGILFVGSGFKEPRDWVPLFGSVYDAYSLRKFWGRVWHQILRRQMLSHGRFLAHRVLRLNKGSLASFLVQMYVGFAISALIHFGGEYSVLGRWSCQHAVRFFFLQAIGVSVETIVVEIGKKFSIRGPWFLVGYLWVFGWFMYTLPDWMDPLFRKGMTETSANFGILDSWLKGI